MTRFSMTLVLRLRVRTPVEPVKRGRSMSRLGLCSCRRLGAVPTEDGAREEGDVESASQAPELSRDVGGRELMEEGGVREGVISREAAVLRASPPPALPGRRRDVLAEASPEVGRARRARAAAAAETRSGLDDIARPEGVRVMGDGGPDRTPVPKTGRSDTDRVIRGREVLVGKRGATEREAGMRRVDALG